MRHRVLLLLCVLGFTVFMGFKAKDVQLSYEVAQVVPNDDPDFIAYQAFQRSFGQDGNIMVLGVKEPNFFTKDFLGSWEELANGLKEIDGVDQVVSIFDAQELVKNKAEKKFDSKRIFEITERTTQNDIDSLVGVFKEMPFYEGSFYNFEHHTTFMAIAIDRGTLASEARMDLLDEVFAMSDKVLAARGVEARYSGLPYIRTRVAASVKKEMQFFSVLSLMICAGILLLFFRSAISVIFPVTVIFIIVIWSLGTITLFDFRINAVTSLVPPLIIIIGVPNFIYLVNKYHSEFKKHGNKVRAIHRMIQKIGVVTLMTNATTAIGFLVLAFTNSPVLKEFGLVAGINIFATFVVSIIVIPVFFSYLPEPKSKHTNYLDKRGMQKVLDFIDSLVQKNRPVVFVSSIAIVLVSLYGVTKLEAVGFVLDDMPKEEKVYKDLKFFESNFGGVLPFEVMIDTKEPKGVNDLELAGLVSEFQDSLKQEEALSRSYSVTDLVKFSRQAYYNGNSRRYGVPSRRERNFMATYMSNSENSDKFTENLVDSTQQFLRVSSNIADVGSVESMRILEELRGVAASIFGDKYEVSFTGISLLFAKNNEYLIRSLVYSLLLAFVIISVLMGLLFKKVRMIIVSLLPNFIPLIATAGIMGYMGIALKPSTVLVFSIAFGISIDDALHFLAKYRQELTQHNWNIPKTISVALRETGQSMIYTSIVLFAGFSIFILSDFGGTSSLGFLTSITLLIAMVTNLILLPSLILSFFSSRSALK